MGRKGRQRSERLGEKLLKLRSHLGLSQAGMADELGFDSIQASSISLYESDQREPPYPILLKYARLAGCTMEQLVDDEVVTIEFKRPVRKSKRAS